MPNAKTRKMPKTITVTKAEFDKRAKEVAEKSFILGVDWMCKLLIDSSVYEFSKREAELFHKRAESIFAKATAPRQQEVQD